MSAKSKTIKSISDLDSLVSLTRDEIYKALKPTIDAANKRLKRQGIDLKLSTKGKSGIELIALAKRAIGIQPKQTIGNPKSISQKPSKVLGQLPQGFEKMKRDEFIKQIQPTIDAANKRVKRLQELKTLSPALNSVLESGGRFSIKGKSRNEILKEASRAIAFINMKTSTVSGAKDFEARFQAKLSNRAKGVITNDQRKALWDGFRKLQQISKVGLNVYGSDRLIRMLADEVVEYNIAQDTEDLGALVTKYEKILKREYEEYMSEYDDLNPFDL